MQEFLVAFGIFLALKGLKAILDRRELRRLARQMLPRQRHLVGM